MLETKIFEEISNVINLLSYAMPMIFGLTTISFNKWPGFLRFHPRYGNINIACFNSSDGTITLENDGLVSFSLIREPVEIVSVDKTNRMGTDRQDSRRRATIKIGNKPIKDVNDERLFDLGNGITMLVNYHGSSAKPVKMHNPDFLAPR